MVADGFLWNIVRGNVIGILVAGGTAMGRTRPRDVSFRLVHWRRVPRLVEPQLRDRPIRTRPAFGKERTNYAKAAWATRCASNSRSTSPLSRPSRTSAANGV